MQFDFQNLCHIILYGKIRFFSAIFVHYKCCGSNLCVWFHGKIMPDSVFTKWDMIIGKSNVFKTEIFVHSYNPIKTFRCNFTEIRHPEEFSSAQFLFHFCNFRLYAFFFLVQVISFICPGSKRSWPMFSPIFGRSRWLACSTCGGGGKRNWPLFSHHFFCKAQFQ